MSAGKGDKLRPVNKTRYDVNFTAINWKSRSIGRPAEVSPKDRIATGTEEKKKP